MMPVCALALLLTSCSSHEQISKLDSQYKIAASIACEGVFLAEFARGGHSTASYTRGHAQFLASRSEEFLSDLNKLEVRAEDQRKLQELRTLAAKLEKLTTAFPTEQAQASELGTFHEQFATIFQAVERLRGRA